MAQLAAVCNAGVSTPSTRLRTLVLQVLVVSPESSGGNPPNWPNKQLDLFCGRFLTPTLP